MTAEEIVKSSGSNFASSFWFLTKEKRNALTVVYAYCRLTDDIVDQAPDRSPEPELRSKLDQWRSETARSFQGKAGHPVLKELSAVAGGYHIPENYFHQLIDGVQMDLEKKSYETFDELYSYCYRVASVVGLICLEVFGYEDARTKEYAVNLGIAFQLTNILRDIKTDRLRGRTYIPKEDLEQFGLDPERFLSFSGSSVPLLQDQARFEKLVHFECGRAESYYKKAEENLVAADRSNLLPAEIMNSVYHSILSKIEKRPLSVISSKIKLSKPELFYTIFKGWLCNRLCL